MRETLELKTRRSLAGSRQHLLNHMLYGQRVVLVGGAVQFDAAAVEQADFLVCINAHVPEGRANINALYTAPGFDTDTGVRVTDFVAYALGRGGFTAAWARFAQEHAAVAVPYCSERFAGTCPYGPEFEWGNALGKTMNTFPLTGMLALEHLLSFPVDSVTLTGFTFWSDVCGYIPHHRDTHDLHPQVAWLRRKMAADARIKLTHESATAILHTPLEAVREITIKGWTGTMRVVRPLGKSEDETCIN